MNYPLLTSYLCSLGRSHPEVTRVIKGDAEEISKKENFEGSFPLYWVETPEPKMTVINDRLGMQWFAAIVVLCQRGETQQDQEIALTTALTISTVLLQRLQLDQEDGVVCIQDIELSGIELDVVDSHADHMVGIRISMPLTTSLPTVDMSVLSAVPYKPPTFIVSDGSFVETSTLPSGYARSWHIQANGGIEVTATEASVAVPADYEQCYAELTYQQGDHRLTSSVYLQQGKSPVFLPYAKNPFA